MLPKSVVPAVAAIIATGLIAVVCLSQYGRNNSSVALVGDPWMTDYLLASPDDYNMNDGIEGLSSSFPFKDPMTAGPEVLKAQHAQQSQVLKAYHTQQSQLSLRKDGPILTVQGYPSQQAARLAMRRSQWASSESNLAVQSAGLPVQQLCGLGSGCEYENENNVAAAKNLDEATVIAGMPAPPSDAVVKEVQEAIAAYDSEMQFQKKLNAGDPANMFKVKQARTQVLCGLDAGCEDDSRAALETAAKVDGETVSADMPEFPSADTIDDVYKAIEDRRVMDKEEDKRRRGKPPVINDDRE